MLLACSWFVLETGRQPACFVLVLQIDVRVDRSERAAAAAEGHNHSVVLESREERGGPDSDKSGTRLLSRAKQDQGRSSSSSSRRMRSMHESPTGERPSQRYGEREKERGQNTRGS